MEDRGGVGGAIVIIGEGGHDLDRRGDNAYWWRRRGGGAISDTAVPPLADVSGAALLALLT